MSIGKFKFTGGAKPTLEEKKMLSVDSIGNFRISAGNGNRVPTSSPESGVSSKPILSHGKSGLSSDSNRRPPLGAVELISAFEALPEKSVAGSHSGYRR